MTDQFKVKVVADTDPMFAPGYIAALRETIEKRNATIANALSVLKNADNYSDPIETAIRWLESK